MARVLGRHMLDRKKDSQKASSSVISRRRDQMFQDREDAAHQLAQSLRGRKFRDPLVLAIPRGGVVTGAVLARELEA